MNDAVPSKFWVEIKEVTKVSYLYTRSRDWRITMNDAIAKKKKRGPSGIA